MRRSDGRRKRRRKQKQEEELHGVKRIEPSRSSVGRDPLATRLPSGRILQSPTREDVSRSDPSRSIRIQSLAEFLLFLLIAVKSTGHRLSDVLRRTRRFPLSQPFRAGLRTCPFPILLISNPLDHQQASCELDQIQEQYRGRFV